MKATPHFVCQKFNTRSSTQCKKVAEEKTEQDYSYQGETLSVSNAF